MTGCLAPAFIASAVPGRDCARDDLRGRDAVAVSCAHYNANGTVVDPAFAPPKFLWDFKGSVLAAMFSFIPSGYGIGLASRQRIFADRLFG